MSYDRASETIEKDVQWAVEQADAFDRSVGARVVGQKASVRRLFMALVADGHVLVEGLPGLAKTTLVKALAEATGLRMSRIQFTPDLLPADIVGTQLFDPRESAFRVRKGPVFASLVLADEINRAPAKVQAALLEAMQERQVTIGEQTFTLEDPFWVMATQNPIEQEGTYPLPEAQVDRFLFKLRMRYGTPEDEMAIVAVNAGVERPTEVKQVLDRAIVKRLRSLIPNVHVADKVRRYVVDVVFATRGQGDKRLADVKPLIEYGSSPRGSINLERAARVNALLDGRAYVTPQDVKDVGLDVLRHRVIRTYEAEADGIDTDAIVKMIFDRVDVP